MCGRYALFHVGPAHIADFRARYQVDQLTLDLAPRYNIAPGQDAPVIVVDDTGAHKVHMMRWGLVPAWSKTHHPEYPTFNARAEGLEQRAAFRGPLRQRRCLVPADGFYEWSGTGKKQAYFIQRRDEQTFSFAGLYDRYRQADGQWLESFTIITTTPNATIAPIHTRMAVILDPADEEEWCDPTVTDAAQVTRLLRPSEDDLLRVYSVGPRVNNARNEGADLLAPSAPPTLF